MQLEWMYFPATQYCVTGVGLIASLSLWISTKMELRAVQKGIRKSVETLDSGLRDVSTGLAEIRTARQAAPEPAPISTGQALNLTKRAQVLRMHRRGESINSIAGALQIPLGEVSLLLKIERLLEPEPR